MLFDHADPVASHGVTFLEIGVNGGSTFAELPPIFHWKDPSGASLTMMYHHDYGGIAVVPDSDLALVTEVRGDNSGPQWYTGRVPPRSAIPGIYFSQGIWPASLTHLGNGYVAAGVVAEDLGVRDQEWWRSAPMERFLERYVEHVRGS